MSNPELKELRLAAGFTREELAKKLFTTGTTIYRWETGRAKPSELHVKMFKTICR